jgi:GTP-binding protein EngB required for normal cell division
MRPDLVPEFAIVGHPNEGKSSVLSTLAEDDSVRVSATPGETVVCQPFPVVIDGREIIRFIDTPGFQHPGEILHQLQGLKGETDDIIASFRAKYGDRQEFRQDVELLLPLTQGAGIIYVVDGSRPVRSVDRAEMEILRLTGLPRMAILNSKDDAVDFLDQWKEEFRKTFNVFRVFNAHRATYAERIALLEALKHIDQDWQATLDTVIAAFKKDWTQRNQATAGIITAMLEECLSCTLNRNLADDVDEDRVKADMQAAFEKNIRKIEHKAQQQIRGLFKHNIFNYDLPPQSILHEDMFSESTWKFLGLTSNQQIVAAGIGGAGIAAAIDAATAGASFGVFAALGGLAGAGWAALSGKGLARTRIMGVPLGGREMQIGPVKNIQFLYILLDRSLIYYSHIINWAHGRRDVAAGRTDRQTDAERIGYTARWDSAARGICAKFFREATAGEGGRETSTEQQLKDIIIDQLRTISNSEQREGR